MPPTNPGPVRACLAKSASRQNKRKYVIEEKPKIAVSSARIDSRNTLQAPTSAAFEWQFLAHILRDIFGSAPMPSG